MKHLGISGGGTKVAGLFGIAESILFDRNYKPDIISGISAGAILAVPLAMSTVEPEFRDKIRKTVLGLKQRDFFNNPPVKPDGRIRLLNALWKIITGKYFLGRQDNLKKTIQGIISREDFSRYVKNDEYPICIVGTVDFYTGKRWFFNLKEATYELFLEYVNASAAIPIFVPGYEFEGTLTDFDGESETRKFLLFDGGVRDHSPSNKILGSASYGEKITETATIFSRPEDLSEILDPNQFEPTGILKILSRFVEITNAEVSKNDKDREDDLIESRGDSITDRGTFYLPRVMKDVYDVDPGRIKELYEASKKVVTDETWLGEKSTQA